MLCRSTIATICLLVSTLTLFADGFSFNRAFRQIRETHQLAVINLTETSADVSMFIAIEGIPAGEEITYILPFWYQPEGFSLQEDTARAFRDTVVSPVHEKVKLMQRIGYHHGSDEYAHASPLFAFGPIALVTFATLGKSRSSSALLPYATNITPHASAELFNIRAGDLQQLIRQSGLPEKYLQPLAKYHTPYFAVMRLRGLSIAEKNHSAISGRGIRYHFTHHLSGGRYVYPLGTGAAWAQPIPITEIYMRCPERLQLTIMAPVEGEHNSDIVFHANWLINYLAKSREERKKDMFYLSEKEFLAPQTGSLLPAGVKHPFAWHIAYLQSNPAEDISVQIAKRAGSLRLWIAEFFAHPGMPTVAAIFLYLLTWVVITRVILFPRWRRAGSPGQFYLHGLAHFIETIGVMLLIEFIPISIFFSGGELFYDIGEHEFPKQDWILVVLPMAITLLLAIAVTVYVRKGLAPDWRKGMRVISWLCATVLFIAMSFGLFQFIYWCEKAIM